MAKIQQEFLGTVGMSSQLIRSDLIGHLDVPNFFSLTRRCSLAPDEPELISTGRHKKNAGRKSPCVQLIRNLLLGANR
jgi:hypothetical protein